MSNRFLIAGGCIISLLLFAGEQIVYAQPGTPGDTTDLKNQAKYELFYDSLEYRAKQKKFTFWIHNVVIPKPKVPQNSGDQGYDKFSGKTISGISITPLDVFGPTFSDTLQKPKTRIERFANSIHTKTDLDIIRKNLFFKTGDKLNPTLIYENERVFRQLPYIRDARIIIIPDSANSEAVKIKVLTKDVFSFGISGRTNSLETAALEVYNKNIFGAGHEVAVKAIGHMHKEPYIGFESFYNSNNLWGKFVNLNLRFSNTFQKEGFSIDIEKEFLTPLTRYGWGASFLRLTRSDRITDYDPVRLDTLPLNYALWDVWAGRSIQLKPGSFFNSQLTFSGRVTRQYFYKRPLPDGNNNQYFSNSTIYLAGLSWSQRKYRRDQLVYSYGITEDIPEGYKNEFIFGYEANEAGDRYYAHLQVSNGNLIPGRQSYLYLSGAIGGYFNKLKYQQGLINFNANYISRLFTAGDRQFRFFWRLNYMLGLHRFEVENLYLSTDNHIRGFYSRIPEGKQRLSVNIETVFFERHEIYRFSIALFTFADVGIIGSNKRLIFKEDYYTGLGLGIRLHNESLVLKTIQLRLAFYPNHPNNLGFVNFIADEQNKTRFYSFQPGAPTPIRFY